MSEYDELLKKVDEKIKSLELENAYLKEQHEMDLLHFEIDQKHIRELKNANKQLKLELMWNERE